MDTEKVCSDHTTRRSKRRSSGVTDYQLSGTIFAAKASLTSFRISGLPVDSIQSVDSVSECSRRMQVLAVGNRKALTVLTGDELEEMTADE